MTQHLILSGGIFHEFDQTTSMLIDIAKGHGLSSRVCRHPDEAIKILATDDVKLFSINALRWEMTGTKYDPYRQDWRYCIDQAAIDTIRYFWENGGGIFGLHTASICFSNWPEWSDVLGGRWIWDQSFHPDKESLKMTPTETGKAFGLAEFSLNDELYSNLELARGTEVLMNGTNQSASSQPLIWRRSSGVSRSVYDALGHDAESLAHPAHAETIKSLLGWILNG